MNVRVIGNFLLRVDYIIKSAISPVFYFNLVYTAPTSYSVLCDFPRKKNHKPINTFHLPVHSFYPFQVCLNQFRPL